MMLALRQLSPGLFGLRITNDQGVGNELPLVEFSWLDDASQLALLQPGVEYFNGRRYQTQVSAFSKLRALFKVLRSLQLSTLPKDEEGWQTFLLNAFSLWMTRKCTASIASSINDWNRAHRFYFQLLQDSTDLIPLSVVIPEASKRIAQESATSFDSLLGQTAPIETFRSDQLIVELNLERSDADYLDEIRDELAYRSHILEQCCLAWWRQIEEHYKYGEKLVAQTDRAVLQAYIANKKYREYRIGWRKRMGHYHFANGDNDISLGYLLTLIKEKHQSNFRKDLLENTDYLPHLCSINISDNAPAPISSLTSTTERLNWMLGNLSPTDISFALTLLTIQHPKFTPEAIANAKLSDKNGNPYLESDELGYSFRVNKHRANAMKNERLTEQTTHILRLILDMTAYHRARLKLKGSFNSNFFFLCTVAGGQRSFSSEHATKFLSGNAVKKTPGTRWLGDYFPQLTDVGISIGTLSLRKVRTTQGVLEWFKTHSAETVARKLGNSVQVSIEYYLPKALLTAWHTRLLRKFQNIWLATASANEHYQLAVTDFSDLAALHSFLLKILELLPDGTSPLAKELHRRTSQGQLTAFSKNAIMSIPASTETFLALYLYKESAMSSGLSPALLRSTDPTNGISPHDLITLSDLVRTRASEDRNPHIREAHQKALASLPEMNRKTCWVDLIAHWGARHAKT